MKTILFVVYVVSTGNIQFNHYEQSDMDKCKATAQRMVDRAVAGQLRAFCLKVKEV